MMRNSCFFTYFQSDLYYEVWFGLQIIQNFQGIKAMNLSNVKLQPLQNQSSKNQIKDWASQSGSSFESRQIYNPSLKLKKFLWKRNQRNSKKMSAGVWNTQENLKYLTFLKKNKSILEDPKQRKKKKIYYKMSLIINSRTADQCRGHHLKYQKRHGTIEAIIKNLQKIIDENSILSRIVSERSQLILKKEGNKADLATMPCYEDTETVKVGLIKVIVDMQFIQSWEQA